MFDYLRSASQNAAEPRPMPGISAMKKENPLSPKRRGFSFENPTDPNQCAATRNGSVVIRFSLAPYGVLVAKIVQYRVVWYQPIVLGLCRI